MDDELMAIREAEFESTFLPGMKVRFTGKKVWCTPQPGSIGIVVHEESDSTVLVNWPAGAIDERERKFYTRTEDLEKED